MHSGPRQRVFTRRSPRWHCFAAALLSMLMIAGCAHLKHSEPAEGTSLAALHPRLRTAGELYAAGDFNGALRACVEISHSHPNTPGLVEFRERVLAAHLEAQAREAARQSATSRSRMSLEALQATALPASYGLRSQADRIPEDHLSPDSPMRRVLDTPVSISLKEADLSTFIGVLASDENINIIADHGLGKDKRMDIEVSQAPLREVLAYAARNLEVQFYLGDHIIWVTGAAGGQTAPLETMIYRLRQGFQMHADQWGAVKDGENVIANLSQKAAVLSQGQTYLEDVIEKMVPPQEGAVLHFDRNLHTLFVRNTRENLEIIDRIVKALDTTPPQVLIEARFIEILVGDLRETGIEWILNSPLILSKKGVTEDGQWERRPQVQVRPEIDAQRDSGVAFTPYQTAEGGPHPLGPQGVFGMISSPSTAVQGLNLAVEGILTRPLFEAVLHALEISGQGRTLSMPRVTTMNNNPAKLRSGEDLRYFEEFQAQAFNLVDANNQRYTITVLIPRGKPSMEELGITLVAVPSVGADLQRISLILNPTISSLEGFVNYQDDTAVEDISPRDRIRQVVVKLPIFARREVSTKLTVQSGETVVMGGLIDTVSQETVHKVPILGDLPGLGPLFRRTGVTEQRRNLLIFVTATVISDRGESLVLTP